MPMEYTKHDLDLCDAVVFTLVSNASKLDAVKKEEDKSKKILFQFPPKVANDSRRGTWHEGELRGTEPVAVFATSGPREITFTYTYIVDGGRWSAGVIANQVSAIRGYFARIRSAAGSDTRNLIVKFKLWLIGGKNPMTFRIVNIDVKHSDTIVGVGDNAFPLRTDITLDLRLWTKGRGAEEAKDKALQKIDGLNDNETPDWY